MVVKSTVRESGEWCVHMVVVAAVLHRLYHGWGHVVCGRLAQFAALMCTIAEVYAVYVEAVRE
jgi:hypothetical protein